MGSEVECDKIFKDTKQKEKFVENTQMRKVDLLAEEVTHQGFQVHPILSPIMET